jgi:hypothetical protein
MSDLLTNKFVAGALAGLLSAAAVDFQAFRSWKSFNDAVTYDWTIALWRWFQGAAVGALAAAGIAGVS